MSQCFSLTGKQCNLQSIKPLIALLVVLIALGLYPRRHQALALVQAYVVCVGLVV